MWQTAVCKSWCEKRPTWLSLNQLCETLLLTSILFSAWKMSAAPFSWLLPPPLMWLRISLLILRNVSNAVLGDRPHLAPAPPLQQHRVGGQVEVGVEEGEGGVERESGWEAGRSLLEHFQPNVSVRMWRWRLRQLLLRYFWMQLWWGLGHLKSSARDNLYKIRWINQRHFLHFFHLQNLTLVSFQTLPATVFENGPGSIWWPWHGCFSQLYRRINYNHIQNYILSASTSRTRTT